MTQGKNKLIKFGLTILVGVLLFNLLSIAPNSKPQISETIKGVWVTHVGNSLLTYTGRLDNVFHHLSQQNFNTVYVDVYNRGTTYPSNYAPRNKLVSLPLRDPLQAAITQGMRQGLNIYAWYEYGMMVLPQDTIAQQHPDWLLSTNKGKQFIEQHLWLNPSHPEVRQYFVDLFTEVAIKYPNLYGIQLDDHWGIPIVFGNQTQAMTELTRLVVTAIRQANPNLIISLSPNPYQFSLKKYSLDWLQWLKEDLFDELVMQIYRIDSNSVRNSIVNSGIKDAKQYVKVAVGIFAGGEPQLKSFTEITKQIEVVKEFGYGYSVFCWEYTSTVLRRIIYFVRSIR